MRHVICVGMPLHSTLLSLANFCRHVTVVCTDETQEEQMDLAVDEADLRNVEVLLARPAASTMLPDQPADLLLINGRNSASWLNQHTGLRADLLRLLTADGLVYHEYVGNANPFDSASLTNREMCQFWLTPLSGEMHTAVPQGDRATTAYFRQKQLYSPSVNKQLIKRMGAALGKVTKRQSAPPAAHLAPIHNKPAPTAKRAASGPKRHLRKMARQMINAFLDTVETAEEHLSRQPVTGPMLRRRGVLQGSSATELAQHPPRYLRQIAHADGVDLDGLRWGLSASGEYSSRKLLFFLFNRPAETEAIVHEPSLHKDAQHGDSRPTEPRPTEPQATEPRYIVKMVRDSVFNERLENECRSLRLLHAAGVGDAETLPQVVFAGHHDGLALVGETAVAGIPLRSAAHYTAECPYVHAAIDWLTDMAVKTVNPTGHPQEVGGVLRQLFEQFDEIYQLKSEHRTFLANQLARIEQSQAPLPLVFQHGDPGTWNMMATPSGRVAILDWEAAETNGMPLWDLFYFLRSYTVGAARAHDSVAGFQQQIFHDTPLRALFSATTTHYCRQIGLDLSLAESFFYTCWMHRALKESTRLPVKRLGQGHYVNLLATAIENRHAVQTLWTSTDG
ncbi:MAG: aminoglycoside phosphotransferase family protein [Caldilineaceae bacterium]|nr:aminoglycoside phosphotransferase family protein [Caldilineaceae bacterium]